MSERPTIRRLRAEDAEAVVRCFERCYAGTYPADAFHDADEMASLVEADLLRSVIAVRADGEVVGHMGLRLRSADAITAVAGNTVVDPEARGHKLAGHLGAALMKLAVDTGLVGSHGFPTTAHPVIQKLEVDGGGFETGVLFDYIPAETTYVGVENRSEGRLAVVVIYRPLGENPKRVVHLPRRHASLLGELFERMRLDRSVEPHGAPLARRTRISVHEEARRGLVRIDVEEAGEDLSERVEAACEASAAEVTLLDLALADPAIDEATERLAGAGFFFGGLLPELTSRGDVLRLQRPHGEAPTPNLATERAKDLLAYVRADRDDPHQ